MLKLPPRAELLSRFSYDPESGLIIRRDNGKRAFATEMNEGYLRGKVGGTAYRAHRVAWKMFYGVEPGEIDHINGIRDDNRIANLRTVSRQENQRNRRRPKNNTSGITGVRWHSRSRRWVAQIVVQKRCLFLGNFLTKEAAAAARSRAEQEHGFSKLEAA